MKNILSIAAFAVMLSAGGALAQTTAAPADPAVAALFTPFYADADLATLKPADQIKAAWDELTPENQAKIKDACVTPADERTAAVCTAVGGL